MDPAEPAPFSSSAPSRGGLALGNACHLHPDRQARLVACERCGDFRCDACFDDDLEALLCASCVPQRLPWRRAQTLSTLYDTTKLVIMDGPRFFGTAVGTGEEQKAASYAVYAGLASYLPLFLFILGLGSIAALSGGGTGAGEALFGGACMAFVCFAPSIALGQLLRGWFYGVVYHATARLLGGRASSTSSFDAAYLSMGLGPIQMLGSVISLVPLLGPLLGLPFFLAVSVWGAHLVACHARARHGLSTVPAYVAALAPIAVGVGLMVVFYGVVIAAAISRRMPS